MKRRKKEANGETQKGSFRASHNYKKTRGHWQKRKNEDPLRNPKQLIYKPHVLALSGLNFSLALSPLMIINQHLKMPWGLLKGSPPPPPVCSFLLLGKKENKRAAMLMIFKKLFLHFPISQILIISFKRLYFPSIRVELT